MVENVISCSNFVGYDHFFSSVYFWGREDPCNQSRRKMIFTLIKKIRYSYRYNTPIFGYKMAQCSPKTSTSSNMLRIDIIISLVGLVKMPMLNTCSTLTH